MQGFGGFAHAGAWCCLAKHRMWFMLVLPSSTLHARRPPARCVATMRGSAAELPAPGIMLCDAADVEAATLQLGAWCGGSLLSGGSVS